jgi:hypothetical protein
MTTQAEATAAPVPFDMGNAEYLLSPLSAGDISELDNWLRARMVRAARESLPDDATADQRRETIGAAVLATAGVCLLSDLCASVMATPDGLARVIWQSVKRNHPRVTPRRIEVLLLKDDSAIDESLMAFDIANNSPTVKKKKTWKQRRRDRKKGRRRTTA